MLRDSHLGAIVRCLASPWPWETVIDGLPGILEACPCVKSIECEQSLKLNGSPGFHCMDSMSVNVHHPSRKDPSPGIKACKKITEELRAAGWLGVSEGGVRVHVTATAEFKGCFSDVSAAGAEMVLVLYDA